MPKRVLVVEDNVQNLELVEFLLEEAGLAVDRALDAAQARESLRAAVPDLILLDMDVAGTNGLTLVGEFRAAGAAETPILALTAHAMRGDRERFLAGGCDGYIAKPINVATFIVEIGKFLERKASA